jgi:HlyD family secretion protein
MGSHPYDTFKLRRNWTPFLWSLLLLVVFLTHLSSCKKIETVQLAGMVERKTLELSAPISEIIVDIPVTEGQRIEADQIIVQLDTEVVAAELSAQEAALAAADAFQSEAEGEFKRQENLRRARVASPKALDVARRARDEALAQVAEKKARVLQAQKRLEDLTIRSRISGVVDQLPFAVGERVPAGGVVGVVISDDKPWVRVWLPSRVVARDKSHLEAKVQVQGLESWLKGTLEYISREPEFTPHYALTERESTHLVYESRIALQDAPDDLRPGLPAQVVLNFKKPD